MIQIKLKSYQETRFVPGKGWKENRLKINLRA